MPAASKKCDPGPVVLPQEVPQVCILKTPYSVYRAFLCIGCYALLSSLHTPLLCSRSSGHERERIAVTRDGSVVAGARAPRCTFTGAEGAGGGGGAALMHCQGRHITPSFSHPSARISALLPHSVLPRVYSRILLRAAHQSPTRPSLQPFPPTLPPPPSAPTLFSVLRAWSRDDNREGLRS